MELSRVCSFVKSVFLIFFKDIFLNIVVNLEEYIPQILYCKAWIFSALDMNEWLKPGKFPHGADEQRDFFAIRKAAISTHLHFPEHCFWQQRMNSGTLVMGRRAGRVVSTSLPAQPGQAFATAGRAPGGKNHWSAASRLRAWLGLMLHLSRASALPGCQEAAGASFRDGSCLLQSRWESPLLLPARPFPECRTLCLTGCTDNLKKRKWLNFQPLTFPAAILHH